MKRKPTTLITGAGKRIGAAIARHLAGEGHDLVLHYHQSADAATRLADELRATGVAVTLLRADLSDITALEHVWQDVPPVTQIIHNASRYTRDRLENFTAAALRDHLAVNLEAPLMLTQGFLRQLPDGANGHVVVLGDDALRWSVSPEFFTYAVSKHSLRTTLDLLAAACAPHVQVNMVALAPTLPNETDPAGMFERLAAQAPLQRTGEVDEVLAAIDFVLKSPGITGQIIGLGNGMGLATYRA